MTEKLFDCRVRLPHAHRASSLRQSPDDGPLDDAVAETKLPRSRMHGSTAADALRDTVRPVLIHPRRSSVGSHAAG